MSLISCPSCNKKFSDKIPICPNCNFSFTQNEEYLQKLKVLKYRKYRNKMYHLKMLTFLSIAITLGGAVPMVWNYIKAIDYGFNPHLTNHWGIYLILAGFVVFIIVRVLMFNTKRIYKSSN